MLTVSASAWSYKFTGTSGTTYTVSSTASLNSQHAHGTHVKVCQSAINWTKVHSSTLSVDGVFGSNTQSGVKSFQRKDTSGNLTVDGVCGQNTFARLKAWVGSNKLSNI